MADNTRSRGWCFTINNYTEKDEAELKELKCVYMIYGHEVAPTTGTPHLQGYVYFKDAKTMKTVSKCIPRASLHEANGTADHNYVYCTKDGVDIVERGVRPKGHKGGGESNKERWDRARMAAQEGRFEDIDSDIYLRCYGTIKRIRMDELLVNKIYEDTEQHMQWVYGKAGVGKSRYARETYPGAYLKTCNKWWDGYQGEDVVIIEDFDKDHEKLCHHLKIWGDRYPFPAEVKGGQIKIRPKLIVITSNWHPAEIWSAPQDLEPILRRFEIKQLV